MFLASVARCFFQIPTTKKLVSFLGTNGALREFCGFTRVPSEATFSRFLAVISKRVNMDEVVGALAKTSIAVLSLATSAGTVPPSPPMTRQSQQGPG
jgi:transposase